MTLPSGYEEEEKLATTARVEEFFNKSASELNLYFATSAIQTFSIKGIIQGIVDRLGGWGKDTEIVRCNGGEKRYRFKNPDDAFSHQMNDWIKKVKGDFEAAGIAKGGGSYEIDAKKGKVFQILDALKGGFEARLKAAYNLYHLNPCDDTAKGEWIRITAKMLDFDLLKDAIATQFAFSHGDTNALSKALDNARKMLEGFNNRLVS